MEYKNLVTIFVRGWNFTRSETWEILSVLDDRQLQFKPGGDKWQSLAWEFACIGRTQMVYTEAVNKEKMDFSYFHSPQLPKKEEFQNKKSIIKLLTLADKYWIEAIRHKRHAEDFRINWPGFKMPLTQHITKLAEHERLHHGQIISYFTLAGFSLPANFKKNWSL